MNNVTSAIKSAIVAAIMSLGAGAALAQAAPNVTLFGVMDEYGTYVKPQGSAAVKRLDSSGMLASRWGARGSEDLGDGLSVNFTLEFGLNANDGSAADSNRAANRQSWVGLAGGWGEVRLGRQNTPQFFMNGKFDAFNGGTQASGWNNMSGTAPRVDSAVGYFSPVISGLKGQLLVGRGAAPAGPILAQTRANQTLHAALEYETKTAYLGLNHEVIDNASVAYTTRRTGLGASYAVSDRWRIFGAIGHESRSDSSLKLNLYSVSAAWQVAPLASLAFGYFKLTDDLSGAGHGGADQSSVLYRYSLSKRTTIYTGIAHLQQHGLRNSFSFGGAAVVQAGARPTTLVPGGAIDGYQLGVTHTF